MASGPRNFRRDPDGRPTFGIEIELGVFRAGAPISESSDLPNRILLAAATHLPGLPRIGRPGLFTSAGLLYVEMNRFLEAATWPAADLPAVLRQEDAALEVVRRAYLHSGLAARGGGHHMICCPDDLSGQPLCLRDDARRDIGVGLALHLALREQGRQLRRRRRRCSTSMGTHLNLVVPDAANRAQELLILLATVLPEVVGPGGFVRRDGQLEFWRDPRGAHVVHRRQSSAHDLYRPILKETLDRSRLQIVSLGYASSRVDRTIKYGLLLLAACHAASRRRAPRFRVSRPYQLLQAPPGREVAIRRSGHSTRATRLDILEMLLDEVLAPAADTDFGKAARCEAALLLCREVIDALRTERDPAAIAARVPTSWALKQHLFTRLLAADATQLPTRRWRPPADIRYPLDELAMLAMLEGCVLDDSTRRLLLDQVDGRPWSYGGLYGRDPDAVASVLEGRPPHGAVAPAADICARLLPPGSRGPNTRRPFAADWHGVVPIPAAPADQPAAAPAAPPTALELAMQLHRRGRGPT